MSSKGKSNMVGNREIAQEVAEGITYAANDLNQYTRISTNGENFTPEYDEDGNQTRVRTSTGIWKVQYNAQNRAIRYGSEADSTHVITCVYDSQGRRVEKKEEKEGAAISHVRYVYRGYLQVAAYDLLAEGLPSLWQIIWDPTQEIATRPLAIRANGAYSTYGWDLTKNICETYAGATGFLVHRYAYSPYGLVSIEGDTSYQPVQWSSEMYDAELGLVYYNYRYYNPRDGRWTRRDPEDIKASLNLYLMVHNDTISNHDNLGKCEGEGCSGECAQKCGGAERCDKNQQGCCIRRTKQSNGKILDVNGCGAADWTEEEVEELKKHTKRWARVDFTPACNKHDKCYGTCGASRAACDAKFLLDLKALCSHFEISSNWMLYALEIELGSLDTICSVVADIYYAVVAVGGSDAYEKAQDKTCKWESCKRS